MSENINMRILFKDANGLSMNNIRMALYQLSLKKLSEEVEVLLGIDKSKFLHMKWLDDDLKIPLNNDKDFNVALKYQRKTSQPLNIYVSVISKKTEVNIYKSSNDESKDNFVTHHSVLCDNCHTIITGNRFNCLECFDFDLCNSCFLDNAHNNSHSMIVIRKNILKPFIHKMINNCLRELLINSKQASETQFESRKVNGRRYSVSSSVTESVYSSPLHKRCITNPYLDKINYK